jgi:hypothetical protein
MSEVKPGDLVWARINGVNAKAVVSYAIPDQPDSWNVTTDSPLGKSKGPKMTYLVPKSSVIKR